MARSQHQNETMRQESKEKIQSEALRQFSSKGLFATKIKDIAEAAGMSQGLIYHYYKSKEDIYAELIENALDKMNEAVYMLRDLPIPPEEKIKSAIDHMLKTIEESEDFAQTCRLIAQATNSTAIPESAKQLIEEKRDIPYEIMAEIMREGQKTGHITSADPEDLAILFWTSINGLAIYKATRHDCKPMPDPKLLTRLFL